MNHSITTTFNLERIHLINIWPFSPYSLLFTRTTNFWMGLWTMDGWLRRSPFFPNFRSPTCTVTFRNRPSSSSGASTTMASFHSLRGTSSSLMITMSPTSTLRLGACHSWRRVIFDRYSFLHLCQNCSDRYWTLLQRFLAYRSSLINFPGGGSGTEDFIVIKWFAVSGSKLVGSLMVSTVSGRLFTMAIASFCWIPPFKICRKQISSWYAFVAWFGVCKVGLKSLDHRRRRDRW